MSASPLPERFATVAELEDCLSEPTPELAADLAKVDGDIMILGVAGKMGPTLARMAKRAAPGKRIIGVARFSDQAVRAALEKAGIETIACDLLHRRAVEALPKLPNVVFMAAMKFGASGNPALTWAMNVHAPAIVAETFAASRIVAFSTGCVYPFVPVDGRRHRGHARRAAAGRLRLLVRRPRAHVRAFLGAAGHPWPHRPAQLRHRHALRRPARHRRQGAGEEPIDLSMGHVNVIWQGDANAVALRCLAHTTTPTSPLNVTGPRTLSVRWLAEEFARRFGRAAKFTGSEAPTGWLNDASRMVAEFGAPASPSIACSTGPQTGSPAAWRATASRPTTRCAMAATDRAVGPATGAPATWRIERLQPADAEGLCPLSIEAGWNQVAADWRLMLNLGWGFGVRGANGQWIASALALPLGPAISWISMVLVTQLERGQGLGTRLLSRCLAEVEETGAAAGLDATELGRPIYLPLGFATSIRSRAGTPRKGCAMPCSRRAVSWSAPPRQTTSNASAHTTARAAVLRAAPSWRIS